MALDLSDLRPSKTLFVGAALGMTLMVAGAAIRRNAHARCPIGFGRAHMDEELDRFKRINFCEYAVGRGYRLIRREAARGGGSRGSTASSLLLRHSATDDKIVARLDGDGHWTYFSVRNDRDNGTIIDFVLRRGARTLSEARRELRTWAGEIRSPAFLPAVRTKPVDADRTTIRQVFARASTVADHPYLNSRGLRPEMLTSTRFSGTWRVDTRGDLLFPHFDGSCPENLCGFERKSATFSGFSAGGRKTVWVSNMRPGDDALVITEAVIDAFSYHQLQPSERTSYLSTSGSIGERQARHVAAAIAKLPPRSLVALAADNDGAGDRLAEKIGSLGADARFERHRPPAGKDWNDWLQRCERDIDVEIPRDALVAFTAVRDALRRGAATVPRIGLTLRTTAVSSDAGARRRRDRGTAACGGRAAAARLPDDAIIGWQRHDAVQSATHALFARRRIALS
jgi:hypothetical protein